MGSFIRDFLTARAMRDDPYFARQIMQQQEQDYESQQASAIAKILSRSIGSDPTGYIQPSINSNSTGPIQQQYNQPASLPNIPFREEILNASQATGISPNEIAQIIEKESSFNPNAISSTGPQGLMQLSQAAAQDTGLDPNQRMDPAANIMAGAKYYKQMKDEFGSNAHLAYHAGPSKIRELLAQNNLAAAPQESINYANSFNSNDIGTVLPSSPPMSPGSKFLPQPTVGGSGLLGQDMDPTRRSYLHLIQQLAADGSPQAVAMASELFKEMQQASLADIARTATQKDMAMTNLIPGSKEFSDVMIKSIVKPPNQTNINMNGGRPQTLTPEEQMLYLGKTSKPGEPQPRWTKEGDIKVGAPQGVTEDQSRASQFATGINSALNTIYEIASTKDFTPSLSNKDFIGDAMEKSGIPVMGPYGTAMQSETQQRYGQAKREAETHLVHALSGSGFTEKEEQIKTLAYLPDWGDKPPVVKSKQKALAAQLETLVNRAGPAASPELRAASNIAKKRAENLDNIKPSKTQNSDMELPQLPEGWKWAD